MDSVELVLENKGRTVHKIAHDATVLEAVSEMTVHHIGALLVARGDDIVGIFSERDLMTRVVLAGLEAATTLVGSVMTHRVVMVSNDASVHEVMEIMTHQRVRYVPVTKARRVVGVVSIGDLVRWAIRDRDRIISQREASPQRDAAARRYPE